MANPAPNSPNARGRKAARAETPHEAPIAAPATTDEQIEERLEEQAAAAPVEAASVQKIEEIILTKAGDLGRAAVAG